MPEKGNVSRKVFKRLLKYARPYRLQLILAFIFTLGITAVALSRPRIISMMVQKYIDESQDASMLLFWTIVVIVLLLIEAMFQFFSAYFANLLAQNVINDLRKKLFSHLISFRMKYFDKSPIGSLVTRVVSDIEAISEVFSQGLIQILGDLVLLSGIVVMMLVINWQLALVVIIPIPLLLISTRIFARAIKKSIEQEKKQVNRLNTFVQERLVGMPIVQLFNRQKRESERFDEINQAHRQAHFNSIFAYSIFFPIVEILSSLSIALMLVWGAVVVTNQNTADVNIFPTIIEYTFYVNMLFRPIRQLADKYNTLQRGISRAERVFDTIDEDQNIQEKGDLTNVEFQNDIKFEDVWFAYKDEDWVLKNLNLTIHPGETIAFVGATGAGKSSIVNLLARFYEFQKGNITIGKTDINDISLAYLRRNISIVLQDVFLFSDTILNNITLRDNNITREDVIEASRAVGAHEFIMKLPSDYDYNVQERGGVLSAGQRQLLSFVRAYVYNPHILVLDEATSSVDTESEEMIQNATTKLTKGRTSIVIAHRLSTIQKADKIVVLEKGEIMEIGNHAELLEQDGFYRKLYEKQFLDKDEQQQI